jgi:hypothetical protein
MDVVVIYRTERYSVLWLFTFPVQWGAGLSNSEEAGQDLRTRGRLLRGTQSALHLGGRPPGCQGSPAQRRFERQTLQLGHYRPDLWREIRYLEFLTNFDLFKCVKCNDNDLGVVFTDGEFWREQRRFTMRQLREMGFGKTSVEYQMTDEIRDLIDEIKKQGRSNDDFIVDFKGIFVVSVVNILWAIVGGERFQRDDARFKRLLEDIDLFFRVGNPVRANFPVPVFLLRLFPGLRSYFGVQTDMFEPLQKFIKVGCKLI